MSWQLTGLVSRKKWGGQTRRLLALTLADKANDDGSGVYASVRTLARDSEISEATARRTLKEFLDAGVIVKTGERECLNGRTNIYCLQSETIEAMDDLKPAKQADTPVTVRPVSPSKVSRKDTPVTVTPLAPGYQTPVTVTAKPILEPSLTLTSFELEVSPNLEKTGETRQADKPSNRTTSPVAQPDKPKSRFRPTGCAGFDAAWEVWPQRGRSAKATALKTWRRLEKSEKCDDMLGAVTRYLASPQAKKRDRETGEAYAFVPALERWLAKNLTSWIEAAAAPQQRLWSSEVGAFVDVGVRA